MQAYRDAVEVIALIVDGAGVLVIVLGLLAGAARFVLRRVKEKDAYRQFRLDVGRAILLGLEFLVAGDIIRTVAVAPTLQNVLVLGLIVIIRTFLSMTLQVELEGKWPWQGTEPESPRRVGSN